MRIVIAEDSAVIRAGLAELITAHGHQVPAAVGDGQALLRAVAEHEPNLVVVDVRMPPTYTDDGLRAALELRRIMQTASCSSFSTTWKRGMSMTCWDRVSLAPPRAWGTCWKNRVADVAEGGGRWIDWPPAARSWIPKWLKTCCRPADAQTPCHGSLAVSARYSRSRRGAFQFSHRSQPGSHPAGGREAHRRASSQAGLPGRRCG